MENISLFIIISSICLVTSLSGCTDTAEKKEEKEARAKISMPDPRAAQNRADREAEFQKVVKDPILTPISEPTTSEKAPPEVGYGEKSDIQILREKERAPRIGLLAPLTGELQEYGVDAMNGADLASEELDARGGVKNKEFELLVFDTKGKIKGAQMGVEAFLDRSVLGFIGAATSEVSFSANKAVNEGQLIMISAGSRRRLGDTGPYNFRNTLNDTEGIKDLLNYIQHEKKWKKLAIFNSLVNDYSIQLSAGFKAEILNRGMDLTHELFLWNSGTTYMSEEDTSIGAQVKKLKQNPPDALIYTGDGLEGKQIVREMREAGLDIPMVGGEDLMIPEFKALGEKAKGTLVYSGFNPKSNDPKTKEFVKDYTAKFGKEPTRLAALSYDAFNMLVQAIDKAQSMRPSHIRMALLSIKDFKGVTGPTTIGPTGEAIKKAFIFEFGNTGDKYDFICVREPK